MAKQTRQNRSFNDSSWGCSLLFGTAVDSAGNRRDWFDYYRCLAMESIGLDLKPLIYTRNK